MSKEITRRGFLRLAVLGLAAAYLASRAPGSIIGKETPEEIAERINAKYGVFIPTRQAREFTYRIGTPAECPNSNLSREELREIEAALVEIPYAGHLSPILVIYRNADGFWVNYDGSKNLATGGTYEGRTWPRVIGDLQTDYSDKPLLWLNIDEGLDFGSKTQRDRCRASRTVKTNRENFKHLLYHEEGHGVDREILFRACKSVEEYEARRE